MTVEAVIDALVELLDAADGDPDVELNGDELEPNGDERDRSYITQSNGVIIWQSNGSEDDEQELGTHVPHFGADQTQPPLNFHGGHHAPWGC